MFFFPHRGACRNELSIISLTGFLFGLFGIGLAIAGSTPPTTNHSLSGTLGNNGWYRGDIQVTLTTTDTQSGPQSTAYWIDSQPPTVVEHDTGGIQPFLNPSFEQGSLFNITNWYGGYEGAGGSILHYRSIISPKDGNRSAAIAAATFPTFVFWHNEPHAIAYPVGESFSISAWTRTVIAGTGSAYFEVWGQDADGNNDQLLATSESVNTSQWNWQQVSASFTVPAAANYIYLRLGADINGAIVVYWDFIESPTGADTVEFSFTHTEEGSHTLHYFSEDQAGNIEAEKTTLLKKDTVVPNPWQNFIANRTTCSHCYETSAETRDVTSGVDVSTGEYRFYTEHGAQFWSGYQTVGSVTLSSNGQPASDGATAFVTLTTPSLDFGDSSPGPFRVQFRIMDMAGNLSTSPVYEIASPWMQGLDGSVYIGGEIAIPTSSAGDPHGTADTLAGDDVISFNTSTNWKDSAYTHVYFGATQIENLLPAYLQLKAQAVAIIDGRLPVADGIYIVNGDFDINGSALQGSNYENADMSAVVIVTGDLSISADFNINNNNNTAFLVEGDVAVDKNVERMGGFYVLEGRFFSDPSGQSTKPLIVDGSMIALEGFDLSRDLGDQGPINNTNTPAEKFIWQPDMAMDKTLAEYLNNQAVQYVWQEVTQP